MRETEPNPLEAKRMELIEKIAEEKGRLAEVDPHGQEAHGLHLSIGHLEHSLKELEQELGYNFKHAA